MNEKPSTPKPLLITPEIKIAVLLQHFPELEDVLIAMAPPFKKLKNPILRRTVAKVASLRQAAAVGGLSVEDMINQLRLEVGQSPISLDTEIEIDTYYSQQPDWFDNELVVNSIDVRDTGADIMPLKPLLLQASRVEQGEIIELVTNFLPAPGIDIMRAKGFLSWSTKQGDITRSYFLKS